jgi:hypothetical protein
MIHNRLEGATKCAKRIWSEEGVKGFYRGFMAYGVVHLFMGALMLQVNLRSGYFYES